MPCFVFAVIHEIAWDSGSAVLIWVVNHSWHVLFSVFVGFTFLVIKFAGGNCYTGNPYGGFEGNHWFSPLYLESAQVTSATLEQSARCLVLRHVSPEFTLVRFFFRGWLKNQKCGVETRKTYGRFGPSVGVKLAKLARDVESPNIGLCHYAPMGRQTLPALQNHRCIPCHNCSKNRRRSRLRMNSSAQLCCSKNSPAGSKKPKSEGW